MTTQERRRLFHTSTVLMVAFSLFSLPVLALVLSLAYLKNSRSMEEVLAFNLERSKLTTTRTVSDFFSQVTGTTYGLAQMLAHRKEELQPEQALISLRGALRAVNQLESVFYLYEDGRTYHATYAELLEKSGTKPIDNFAPVLTWYGRISDGKKKILVENVDSPQGTETPESVEKVLQDFRVDPRTQSYYLGAKSSRRVFIARPEKHPTRDEMVIAVTAPIIRNQQFVGVVGATVSVSEIGMLLWYNRVSEDTIAAIVDEHGEVIVPPIGDSIAASDGDARLDLSLRLVRARVREALKAQQEEALFTTTFDAPVAGEDSSVSIFDVQNGLGLRWKMVVITPEDDFIGPIRSTNILILWLLALIVPIQLLLLLHLSRRLSRGIVRISSDIHSIREMRFDEEPVIEGRAKTQEIEELREGVGLLRSALRSFAQYIPLGVVQKLIDSGAPLTLGVERKEITVMFSDLEGFSTIAQGMDPDALLEQLSTFFSVGTDTIAHEEGTIDKFIGDSIMAFWGAPGNVHRQTLRACCAALRCVHRMNLVNERWTREGKRVFRMRIGLHVSEVLVGNIGSKDRLSYTVIGDGVNVASRLEGINKQFGTAICISDKVYEAVADHIVARPLGGVSVKGRQGEFMVYELLGIRNSTDPELAPPESGVDTEKSSQAVFEPVL